MVASTTVLVVDDEPLAIKRLVRLIDAHDDLTLVGEAKNGRQAAKAIRNLSPDLIFLDIQMPGWNGIRVLEEVGAELIRAVVFVTAYDRFALRAFDLHAVDYLLKPFTDERFEQAVVRALGRLRREASDSLTLQLQRVLDEYGASAGSLVEPAPDRPCPDGNRTHENRTTGKREVVRLSVKVKGKVRVLQTTDINWLEASGSYVRVHQSKGPFLVRETLTSILLRLPQTEFLRIHRSTAVNLNRVVELLPFTHRELVLVLEDGKRLKLSRTYREALEARLGIHQQPSGPR